MFRFSVYESEREGRRVRQRFIMHLGSLSDPLPGTRLAFWRKASLKLHRLPGDELNSLTGHLLKIIPLPTREELGQIVALVCGEDFDTT